MFFHRLSFFLLLFFFISNSLTAQTKPFAGGSGKFQHLVWSEEFDYKGLPDSTKWKYDTGYLRNHETGVNSTR